MGFSISWGNKSVSIEYTGEIDNKEIISAHFSLNADDRFYECRSLILDISKCNMDKVSVDDLIPIIGTDLGASFMNESLKVAMIATVPENREKASQYINKCREVEYPWEFELFNSIDDAHEWLAN